MAATSRVSSPNPFPPLYQCNLSPSLSLQQRCRELFNAIRGLTDKSEVPFLVGSFSGNKELIQIFQSFSITKINQCFRNCCKENRVSRAEHNFIRSVTNALYHDALLKPCMRQKIEEINQEIPYILEEINNGIEVNLGLTISAAEFYLANIDFDQTTEPKIKETREKLAEFAHLALYTDESEMMRMKHLAKLLNDQMKISYPNVISDLPAITSRLKKYQTQLNDVAQLHLQFIERYPPQQVLQTREELLFAKYPSYFKTAADQLFWHMLFLEKRKKEVFNVLIQLPLAANAVEERFDPKLLGQFFKIFSPQFDMQKWVAHQLSKIASEQLELYETLLNDSTREREKVGICFRLLEESTSTLLEVRGI